MSTTKYLPFALLAVSQCIFAQQPPSAGSQMQQIPPMPVPQRLAPVIQVTPAAGPAAAGPDGTRIAVRSLRVSGATAYSEGDLLAVTGFRPGSELSLSDLRSMAGRIADLYHANGYFVAQAYLPAQDIRNGVVTIAVIEGRYGNVTLRNQTNVSNGLANGLLGGINSGDPIMSAPLESRLLMLSELPGVKVQSTLVPGRAPGTSDLIVDMTQGARVSGSIDADNAGNRYTGEYRLGATVNLNEPLGMGDVASLRVLTSGPGLNYARGSYQLQLGKAKLGVAYSALRYELRREFAPLQAHGTAEVATVYGSYPLIRSRNNNLSVQLAYDNKRFEDKVDSTATVTNKRAQVLTSSLYGDHRDDLGGGGLSSYSLSWSNGNIDIRTPAALAVDAGSARSNGHFNKLGFSAMRVQAMTDSVSLYAAINGQAASKNLDVSEKMELGGMYAVRAYPEGEAYADEGVVLTLEARMQLARMSEGQVQLIGFVDTGSVTVNHTPWAPGANHRTLSGAGVGLNWTVTNSLVVKTYYAHKVGNSAATSAPDRSGRFWIQAVKYF